MTIILLFFFSFVLSCYLQVHLTCMRKIQVTVVVEQRKKEGRAVGQRTETIDHTPKTAEEFLKPRVKSHHHTMEPTLFSTEPNWKLSRASERLWFHWQNRIPTTLRSHPEKNPCRPEQSHPEKPPSRPEQWLWVSLREVTAGAELRSKIGSSQTDSLEPEKPREKAESG